MTLEIPQEKIAELERALVNYRKAGRTAFLKKSTIEEQLGSDWTEYNERDIREYMGVKTALHEAVFTQWGIEYVLKTIGLPFTYEYDGATEECARVKISKKRVRVKINKIRRKANDDSGA